MRVNTFFYVAGYDIVRLVPLYRCFVTAAWYWCQNSDINDFQRVTLSVLSTREYERLFLGIINKSESVETNFCICKYVDFVFQDEGRVSV